MTAPSPPASEGTITRLLRSVAHGEPGAADGLMESVGTELRRLAHARLMMVRPGASFQTTELLDEAYLRLFGRTDPAWEGRRHFYFAAARAMRDIIVERARRHAAIKRGGDRAQFALDEVDPESRQAAQSILDVDGALAALRDHDAQCADIVLLRYFGDFSHEQVAEITGLSVAKVRREWDYARAWLRRRLEP